MWAALAEASSMKWSPPGRRFSRSPTRRTARFDASAREHRWFAGSRRDGRPPAGIGSRCPGAMRIAWRARRSARSCHPGSHSRSSWPHLRLPGSGNPGCPRGVGRGSQIGAIEGANRVGWHITDRLLKCWRARPVASRWNAVRTRPSEWRGRSRQVAGLPQGRSRKPWRGALRCKRTQASRDVHRSYSRFCFRCCSQEFGDPTAGILGRDRFPCNTWSRHDQYLQFGQEIANQDAEPSFRSTRQAAILLSARSSDPS